MTNHRQQIPPPCGVDADRCRLLKAGHTYFAPDVWVVTSEAGDVVWKTYQRRHWWERPICRWLARREQAILGALSDVEGFPQALPSPDSLTVAMSLLDAEEVPEVKGKGVLTALYFDRLEAMLNAMHERGINHGDLRRKNIMMKRGDPSQPLLIDFTQCLSFRVPVKGLRRTIFEEARRIDRVTFLKLKKWYLGGGALREEETVEAQDIPWHLRIGRKIRKGIYRPIRRWVTGKKKGMKVKKKSG